MTKNDHLKITIAFSVLILLIVSSTASDFQNNKTNITCRAAYKKCPTGSKSLVYQSALGLDQACIGSDNCPPQFSQNISVLRYSGSCDLAGCASKCCLRPNFDNNVGQQCLAYSDFNNEGFCNGLSSGAIAGILIGSIWGFFILLIIVVCVYTNCGQKQQAKSQQSDQQKLVSHSNENKSKDSKIEQHGNSQSKFVIE